MGLPRSSQLGWVENSCRPTWALMIWTCLGPSCSQGSYLGSCTIEGCVDAWGLSCQLGPCWYLKVTLQPGPIQI